MIDYGTFKRFYSDVADITVKDAKVQCNDLITAMAQLFESHEGLRINGFGTFEVVHVEPHEVVMFGKTVMANEKWKLKFKPSPSLIARMNGEVKEETAEEDDE